MEYVHKQVILCTLTEVHNHIHQVLPWYNNGLLSVNLIHNLNCNIPLKHEFTM